MRCPCYQCLVEPVCENNCEDFNKFAKKLKKFEGAVLDTLENFDDFLTSLGVPFTDEVLTWIVEHGGGHTFFWMLNAFLKIQTTYGGNDTRFDDRYYEWENENERKK